MSKEAILFTIDVGSAMDEQFSQQSTRLKISLECLKLTLQQKLFNNTSHEIGFTIFGDNEEYQDSDGNSCTLQEISKPNLDLVRKVIQMSQSKLNNTKKGGDIFKAIQYSCHKISQHCSTKKYNKRMFLFTAGKGQTQYEIEHIQPLLSQLQRNYIKVNIIPIDFMETYDIEDNTINEVFDNKCQQKNAHFMIRLKQLDPQTIQIFPASLAIELYKKFRKRDVNPVSLYRGTLELAPGLDIEVSTFKAIRREKLKSLAKYDKTVPFNAIIGKQKEIISDVSYIVEGDETGTLIDKQNRINAYNYGPHLVPISEILQRETKIYQQKCLKVLGFVDKQKIPRQCLLGEVDIMIPIENKSSEEKSKISKKLFTSFIYSMISLNKYAVARYIARNNKNGVIPKLIALIPYRTIDREMFYLIQLPTVQDIRDYPFNSLKKSSEKQREIIKDLVYKMMLYTRTEEDEYEDIKMENTFNPTRQYFFQAIFHRALHNEDQIPDLDPVIKRYLKPEQRKFQNTKPLMQEIRKEFKFVKKELAKDKVKDKPKLIMKDMFEENQPTQTNDIEEFVMPEKKFQFEDDDKEQIDPKKPIISFKKMLNNNKKDLVDQAIAGLTAFIEQRSKIDSNIDLLIQCCIELRNGCITQKEEEYWDNWLQNSKQKLSDKMCQRIKEEGLGFIKRSNNEAYKIPEVLNPIELDLDDLD